MANGRFRRDQENGQMQHRGGESDRHRGGRQRGGQQQHQQYDESYDRQGEWPENRQWQSSGNRYGGGQDGGGQYGGGRVRGGRFNQPGPEFRGDTYGNDFFESESYGDEDFGRDYRNDLVGGPQPDSWQDEQFGGQGNYGSGRQRYGSGMTGQQYGSQRYRGGMSGQYAGGMSGQQYGGGMSGQQYGGGTSGQRYGSGLSGQQYGSGMSGQQWNDVNGPHTGRGPKNFQRSDERVKEEICERLEQHGQIDASEINVEMKNGTVTLTGTVENRQAKRLAEDVAENTPGVKDVLNQLRATDQGRQDTNRSKDRDKEKENVRHAG